MNRKELASQLVADVALRDKIADLVAAVDGAYFREDQLELAQTILLHAIAPWLENPEGPVRKFTGHHLRIVHLLASEAGATHTRLRRAWDARASRSERSELPAWPWISDSGLRTRTSELKAWGLVEASGAYGETPAGRPSQIWILTGHVPSAIGREALAVPGVDPDVDAVLEALLAEAGDDVLIASQLRLAAEVAGIPQGARA